MKYMRHSIASTTWVDLKRRRIFNLLEGAFFWFGSAYGSDLFVVANQIRATSSSARYHLEMRRRVGLGALLEKRHRRRHADGAMRHAGEGQSHLDTGQRA